MNLPTVDAVRAALLDRKGEWPKLCDETGLGYSWVTKFAGGYIQRPSFDRVMRLAKHLAVSDQREVA